MNKRDISKDISPKLQAMIDQRVAFIKEATNKVGVLAGHSHIMSMLTEPPEHATRAQQQAWDISCDQCGRLCPTTMTTGQVDEKWGDVTIVIVFGLCPSCVPPT